MSSETPGPLEITPALLAGFEPQRILSESTMTGSTFIFGTLAGHQAIIHVQKTVVVGKDAEDAVKVLENVKLLLENAPYYSAHAWTKPDPSNPDYVVKVICPATADHIKKYSIQERYVVRETAEVYEQVVKPYIEEMPVSKIGWVYEILEGRKEAERVYYRSEGDDGFVILPDLKWDETTENALYLTCLVQDRSIKSLRDLKPSHVPLLKNIREKAAAEVSKRFGVDAGKLRLFVHYHPTYYHFHVHIVHIRHDNLFGQVAGQAHLLDDLISLLELSPADGPSLLARKSFTYTLGVEHRLFPLMLKAGAVLGSPITITDAEAKAEPIFATPVNPAVSTPSLGAAEPATDLEEPEAKRARI
ncbi:scavenger mRNA-decapping enzyme DcpS [Cryptococcus deuterogattii R265]|uniref:scavenger mRNA-decapping enzyme DcpS n=1 Tax=Cryptococcus deuterogattii (strain R265) TaxID=294750 RepID=UPI0019367337|nr:scavenger mRNA-decapping enzyme DcpS [Cryptococcus deuterogattii R265]